MSRGLFGMFLPGGLPGSGVLLFMSMFIGLLEMSVSGGLVSMSVSGGLVSMSVSGGLILASSHEKMFIKMMSLFKCHLKVL